MKKCLSKDSAFINNFKIDSASNKIDESLLKVFCDYKKGLYYYPYKVLKCLTEIIHIDSSLKHKISKNEVFSLSFFKDLISSGYTNHIFAIKSGELIIPVDESAQIYCKYVNDNKEVFENMKRSELKKIIINYLLREENKIKNFE
jgi:hypothetical protein